MDEFELYVYQQGFWNWNSNEILSRLLIIWELLLGLLLIVNYKSKIILKLSIFSLVFFSLFLFSQIVLNNSGNCHCFGTYFPMSPVTALSKNIIFIALAIYALIRSVKVKTKSSLKFSLPLIFTFASIFCFSISLPDAWVKYNYDYTSVKTQGFSDSLNLVTNNKYDLDKGKKIVCFFMLSCEHCRLAAGKISKMAKRYQFEDQVLYLFVGKEETFSEFWEASQSTQFEYLHLDPIDFFNLSNKQLPFIVTLENGEMTNRFSYRDLSEKYISNFFLPKTD